MLIVLAFYLEHVGPETMLFSTWLETRPDLNAAIKAIQLNPAAALSPVPVEKVPALYQVRRALFCLKTLEGAIAVVLVSPCAERLSTAYNDTPSLLSMALGLDPTRCFSQITDDACAPCATGSERV